MRKKIVVPEVQELVPEVEKINLRDLPQEVKDFLVLPSGIDKNYKYTKLLTRPEGMPVVNVMKDGKNVFYSETYYRVKRVNSTYFLQSLSKSGISFKENKLNIWFGKPIEHLSFRKDLYTCMNWNFIHENAHGFITKGVLLKLFKGKLTNTRDILKEYAKSVRIKVSTELLYRAVTERGLTRLGFYSYCNMAKEPNHFLEYYLALPVKHNQKPSVSHIVDDLIQQYKILEKKVDFKWSDKRIQLEHHVATKKIMEYEIGEMDDCKIDYPEINLPNEFELIDNQRRLFAEGKIMNHCVYTNYWNSIQNGRYMAFHITLGNENATLGVNINNENKMVFNQLYKEYNGQVSKEMRALADNFLQENKNLKINIKPELTKVGVDDFFADF